MDKINAEIKFTSMREFIDIFSEMPFLRKALIESDEKMI